MTTILILLQFLTVNLMNTFDVRCKIVSYRLTYIKRPDMYKLESLGQKESMLINLEQNKFFPLVLSVFLQLLTRT